MTAGRLLYAKDLLPNEDFFLTYGDGVSNVDLNALQEKHKVNKSVVTLTAIQPSGRFGILQIDSDSKIQAFREKNQEDVSWINGGFMIVNKKIFDYFNSTKDILERDVLPSLINDGNLSALKHKGFWQCMDTMRDKELLDMAIKEKNAPWMVWSND
jgi:glucose-1-phosphate cytidylyltransferase